MVEPEETDPIYQVGDLKVGQPICGYCAGIFGRDSYDDWRIEALGHDWAVLRNDKGVAEFTDNLEELAHHTDPKTLAIPFTTGDHSKSHLEELVDTYIQESICQVNHNAVMLNGSKQTTFSEVKTKPRWRFLVL